MNLDDYCKSVKSRFPEVSARADKLYDSYWNDIVEMDFSSHSWFESLANAVNQYMQIEDPSKNIVSLFLDISCAYSSGPEATKNAIDVAFVENLFWGISKEKSLAYWDALPENLKSLYVGFHGRSPL